MQNSKLQFKIQNFNKFKSTLHFALCTFNLQAGQALVTLLFFMIIAVTIATAAVVISLVNTKSTSKLEEGMLTYYIAESGAENALLRLLRDPNYAGETLQVDNATAVVQVSGSDPKTITSTATNGQFVRKIQVVATYTNNILTITSWNEIQ